MKSQGNVNHGSNTRPAKAEGKTTAIITTAGMSTKAKKKGKSTAVQKVEEERENTGGESTQMVMENLQCWDDQWPWYRGIVDEQMSWGSIWLPFWDVDYMGEAYREMFSDVVWDDDIWNLKGIDKIPGE